MYVLKRYYVEGWYIGVVLKHMDTFMCDAYFLTKFWELTLSAILLPLKLSSSEVYLRSLYNCQKLYYTQIVQCSMEFLGPPLSSELTVKAICSPVK